MRLAALFFALAVTTATAADADKPLAPAEAAKRVNEKVTLEMVVKSTGGKDNVFLNSEEDYKDAKNFTVFLPEDTVEKFKKAKIENPKEYYKGKTIRVTGTVTLFREKPQIKVENPDQVAVVEKK
jgi:DNA/RNA endonuclease YhcR with UshA esterase domain